MIDLSEANSYHFSMPKRNPHTGWNFDDFLKEENLFEEVHTKALKRALAEQIEGGIQAARLTKMAMAEKR